MVPTDIYISTGDDSVDSLDTVESSDSFVIENPDPSFDKDSPLAEGFKIHCIASKYLDTTTASTY